MKKNKNQESSIIKIIQEMVSKGESETKIVSTLKDIGVEEEQAKRLLLLGQANTFSILKGEISNIVKEDLEKEKTEIKKFVQNEVKREETKSKIKIEREIIEDIKKYEKEITGQSNTFQEQIHETVGKMAELSERVKNQLNELGEQVHQIQLDMDEMHLKGAGAKNRMMSRTMIIFGIGFLIADFYLFLTTFGGAINIDSVILTVVMGMIGITLLFVATLI